MPRSRKPETASPGSGLHIYVVAEVNGHADLLRHLLNAIDRVARRSSWTYRVVFTGDVIDFGPHSKQAMDIVSETLKCLPGSCLIRPPL
jgi:serine/threonine protein phosphatase 1